MSLVEPDDAHRSEVKSGCALYGTDVNSRFAEAAFRNTRCENHIFDNFERIITGKRTTCSVICETLQAIAQDKVTNIAWLE